MADEKAIITSRSNYYHFILREVIDQKNNEFRKARSNLLINKNRNIKLFLATIIDLTI